MKSFYLSLMLLFALSVSAFAQAPGEPTPDDRPTVRHEHVITDLALTVFSDGSLGLTITGYATDACDFPVQVTPDPREDILYVDVYRELPITVSCLREDVPYEATIALPQGVALDAGYLIDVNGTAAVVRQSESTPINPGELRLEPVMRHEPRIESARIRQNEAGEWVLTVQGTHVSGCEAPVFVRQQMIAEGSTDTLHVSVARYIPDQPCPRILLRLDETIVLDVDGPDLPPLRVNGNMVETDGTDATPTPPPADVNRVPHVIENVEVRVLESFPMQLQLEVSGYQTDGCDFPVQVAQSREDNTITVNIYREMPEGVLCPANIVNYEATISVAGTFTPGDYTLIVNDQRLDITL